MPGANGVTMPHKKSAMEGMHPDSGPIEKKLCSIVSTVVSRGKVKAGDIAKLVQLREKMQRLVDKIFFAQD